MSVMSPLSCAIVEFAKRVAAQGVRRVWLRDDLLVAFMMDMTEGRVWLRDDLLVAFMMDMTEGRLSCVGDHIGIKGMTVYTPHGGVFVSARGLRP